MDGNPYWDAMVAAASRRRPTVTITWLLTDYTVNKLLDLQEALEDRMRETANEYETTSRARFALEGAGRLPLAALDLARV
jgi:hypothetical protein